MKDNFRELIGSRLEEIHLAETEPVTFPSDEEVLRWEALAETRRREKQRQRKKLLSMAAVFLLAAVIGIAVIVAPPDAEAGGEGNTVIVDNGEKTGVTIMEYASINAIPQDLKKNFILINDGEYGFEVQSVIYSKSTTVEQLEVIYLSDLLGEVTLTEIIRGENTILSNEVFYSNRKEAWGDKTIYIADDPRNQEEKTYMYLHRDVYVLLYTEKTDIMVKKILEEVF